MKIKFIIFLAVCNSSTAFALELMPYPEADITEAQWTTYNQSVKNNYGETEKISHEQKLVTYSDNINRISFAFTLPGHPAHPAWIARQVVQNDEGISMDQIGYFAGEEAPFARLFGQYKQLNKQIEEQFKK